MFKAHFKLVFYLLKQLFITNFLIILPVKFSMHEK